jgi:hypothetical protein
VLSGEAANTNFIVFGFDQNQQQISYTGIGILVNRMMIVPKHVGYDFKKKYF